MSNLGFSKSIVYHGEVCLGEVEVSATNSLQFPNNEIRINYLTPLSERCHPLAVLLTISPFSVRCKLKSTDSSPTAEHSSLNRLYFACFQEMKTAVLEFGEEELHLVAMPSKVEKVPCFWCCSVPKGVYGSCLGLLNRLCLAIVFDLDETLIVANTMKSFEDRIEALQKRISLENDQSRVSVMAAELKRYLEDRSLLKQYTETDSVNDGGVVYKVSPEEVASMSNGHERIYRPVIRLKERNLVLTRINPEIRDTSVLVRLRPAWEDLRNYITAKGRKRFEVFVCTMAERDYALEMWRLLDPEAHLISSNQLLSRVVCVNPGSRKSLLNVFQDGVCHPKMALVIDDRLKVWEDMDQPRVHVVIPFTPYYDPLADNANAVTVMCVARNVACNVRAGFFKEFDENLLRRIFEICYEDEVTNLPYAPDVSDFLMPEDASFVPNGNRDIPISEGMSGAEVERRLNRLDKNTVDSANHDLRPEASHVLPNNVIPRTPNTSLPIQNSALPDASANLEVNNSEVNPDEQRKHLILQSGQGSREQSSGGPLLPKPSTAGSLFPKPSTAGPLFPKPSTAGPPLLAKPSTACPPLLPKPPIQTSTPFVHTRGGWIVEEDSNIEHTNNGSARLSQPSDASQDKLRAHQNLPNPSVGSSMVFGTGTISHASQMRSEEASQGNERKKQKHSQPVPPLSTGDATLSQASAGNRVNPTEAGKGSLLSPFISIGVLHEIGRRCGSKVEFRSVVSTSKDLQFSVEVLFTGEKIGAGMGKTKKDAQQQAAQNALRSLADKYEAFVALGSRPVVRDQDMTSFGNENGFLWDVVDPGSNELLCKEALPNASTSEAAGDASGGSESLGTHQTHKRASSPRSPQTYPSKRLKEELLPGLHVSSSQYQNTGNPVS